MAQTVNAKWHWLLIDIGFGICYSVGMWEVPKFKVGKLMPKLLTELTKESIHVKLYMRYSKRQLLQIASERSLDTKGNKEILAVRCAQEHVNRWTRDYAILSGGH